MPPRTAAYVDDLACGPPLSEMPPGDPQTRSRSGCKRKPEHPLSPSSKRIRVLQQELELLVAKRSSRYIVQSIVTTKLTARYF